MRKFRHMIKSPWDLNDAVKGEHSEGQKRAKREEEKVDRSQSKTRMAGQNNFLTIAMSSCHDHVVKSF